MRIFPRGKVRCGEVVDFGGGFGFCGAKWMVNLWLVVVGCMVDVVADQAVFW
jgi:hypothetical protein